MNHNFHMPEKNEGKKIVIHENCRFIKGNLNLKNNINNDEDDSFEIG